ncbi:MAG TPA: DUF4382 domain-containing protein [Longimicrobiales bacterium]
MRGRVLWTAAVLALALAGCAEQEVTAVNGNGRPKGAPPRLTILLKDAPGDIVEAVVTISKVYLQGEQRVTLRDEPVTTDLVELADSTLTLVDGEEVPPGAYGQLRFVITGGYIAVEGENGELRYFASSPNYEGLPEGVTATGKLHMPSYAQSGLKVELPEGFEVDGEETILVDFDVSQSFGHEAGKSGRWIMHPVITASESEPPTTTTTSITVNAVLADTVTLPDSVTLADFSARIEDAAGDTATLALADTDGDGTFSARFASVDPAAGPFQASLVGPAGLTFTTDPAAPVEVSVDAGEDASVTFTITSTAEEGGESGG